MRDQSVGCEPRFMYGFMRVRHESASVAGLPAAAHPMLGGGTDPYAEAITLSYSEVPGWA
jgi:hypothetical protein